MKSSSPLSSRWRRYALGALVATVISLWGWRAQWRWGALLDNVVHDVGFGLRPPLSPHDVAEELPRSRNIVIVALPHEVPRPLLAKLIGRLGQARAVALDLMLVDRAADLSVDERPLFSPEIARWKDEDKTLAASVKKAGNVIIGVWPEMGTDKKIHWTRPSPLFERSARASSHFEVLPDAQDGLTRRLHLWEDDTQFAPQSFQASAKSLPALSLEVAALAEGKTAAQIAPPEGNRDLWINFLGTRAVLEHPTKYTLFEYALDMEPEDFKDTLVFIGETSFRSKDVFPTPCGDMPGLYVHAQATATLLDARGTPREVPWWGVAVMALGAALVLVAPLARWTLPVCALVAAVEVVGLALGVALLWAKWNMVAPLSVPALAVFLTYNGVALSEYVRTRNIFGRVVGRQMLRPLLDTAVDPTLGGKEEVATALFCDLRGYSAWAKSRTPQELISVLNAYTGTLVRVVEGFGGRPIDFFGDGVFVLFEGSQHARRAVEAALALADVIETNEMGLRAGVALHTGTMVIGLVGHDHHLKAGAVGEAVNLAARVQSLSDDCGYTVLVTRQTLDAWQSDQPVENDDPLIVASPCGEWPIKGYEEMLEVFGLEVIDSAVSQKIA